jgi:hypothetical protein
MWTTVQATAAKLQRERGLQSQPKGTCVDQWPEREHAFNRLGRAQLSLTVLLPGVVVSCDTHECAPETVCASSVSGKEILLHPFSSRTSFKLLLVLCSSKLRTWSLKACFVLIKDWPPMHVLCLSVGLKPDDDDDEAAIVSLSFNLKFQSLSRPPQHLNKPLTQTFQLKKPMLNYCASKLINHLIFLTVAGNKKTTTAKC